jgi:hypothetical protein
MITFKKQEDGDYTVQCSVIVPMPKEELLAYKPKSSIIHVLFKRFELEFKKAQKEFLKSGEKMLEKIK